jgi:hypothetical protein
MRLRSQATRVAISTLSGAVLSMLATAAYAVGESGTGSVSEMQVSGSTLAMLFGGIAVLGVVIWGVIKVLNR